MRALAAVCMIACGACTSVVVRPEPGPVQEELSLHGRVEAEGAAEFLPRPLRDLTSADAPTYRYEYEVRYDENDLGALALLNPLTAVGTPTGNVLLAAKAKLEVQTSDRIDRVYESSATASRTRTVFTGDDLSGLRRTLLLELARSIETQMSRDRDFFNQKGNGK